MLTEMTLVSGDYPGLNVETPIRPLRLLDGANSQRAPYPAANSQFWLVRTAPAQDMSLGCASYARIAHGRALPSMEWRGAHSGAALREPFMDVHAMRCILIHTPRVAVPRSAAPLRLQPFARPGTLANAGRPAHVTAFQPTMKWHRSVPRGTLPASE